LYIFNVLWQCWKGNEFYTSLFDQSEIINITYYGANEAGKEGTVLHATFSLNGQEFMCIDSSVEHDFTFTPAISLYIRCDTRDEIYRLFDWISRDGQVYMPLSAYPFSERFAWVEDKYGISWQLSLEKSW
jgi:predicted 3-demethylubiquinone-9 3-methyltransferase (glyoxalase superfamily)